MFKSKKELLKNTKNIMTTNLPETKVLGKQTSYPRHYSPDILVAVPRTINREIYDIYEDSLPFTGIDVWHLYELGFLTEKGLPVAGVLKMIYPAGSPFLVESKSLKLYLNSFNMEHYGKNPTEGIEIILDLIRKDLSELLKCEVGLCFFDEQKQTSPFDFSEYSILEKCAGVESISFSNYIETPELLFDGNNPETEIKAATHLLRSNCKITQQPDWGSAYIFMKGNNIPSNESLLRYLVSIRNENHFHEEICEMIYQRLWTLFSPEKLMVTCIYTRRGGIDICPVRVSHKELIPEYLGNYRQLSSKLLRQ